MGVRIFEDVYTGRAVFYCSSTDWAFGPVMGSKEEAGLFLIWMNMDPRGLTDSDLAGKYAEFRSLYACSGCGKFAESMIKFFKKLSEKDILCGSCHWENHGREEDCGCEEVWRYDDDSLFFTEYGKDPDEDDE